MNNVNHPPHYNELPAKCKCGKQIECIDVVREMGFNPGNAVKYIWRAGRKGSVIEDYQKAIWYLKDEVRRLGGEPEAAEFEPLEPGRYDHRCGSFAIDGKGYLSIPIHGDPDLKWAETQLPEDVVLCRRVRK